MAAEIVSADTLNVGIASKLDPFSVSYLRNHCVFILPYVGASLPMPVHISLRNAEWLMNTPRVCLEPHNMEVGAAYEEGFKIAMENEACKTFPWVWTYEQDNIQPRDVYRRLFRAIWHCIDCGELMPRDDNGAPSEPWVCGRGHRGLDAVGGLYYTKSIPPNPMAYGSPRSEELDYRPQDVAVARETGALVEVNGLAMGCTLWRKALFASLSHPWFKTSQGGEEGAFNQDLFACRKAKEELGRSGARFAVDTGCLVGHIDTATGVIY